MASKKIKDILVVGELNVDLIFNQLNKPPQIGKEQKAEVMALTLGSSSAIFASNCSSLGCKVAFCGKIGNDEFGDFVLHSLRNKGVDTSSVIIDDKLKTGATVIFNYNDDRMMVTHPGAMEHLTVDEIPEEALKNNRHLHTSSVFFQPGLKKGLVKLFSKAKDLGLSTSLDTQWDPDEKWDIDIDQLLPFLDFFLPNEDEFLRLTHSPNLQDALQKVSKHETCVVIKRGTQGALMQKNGDSLTIPAYSIPDFVDAIGAGDSFDAGLISSFLKGNSLKKSFEFGNLTAAVSTTAAGGTSAIKSFNQVQAKGRKLKVSTS